MSNGIPTFPARDVSPEVLDHMDREERWHREHPGEATPREWYEPAAKPERARDAGPRTTRTRSR